MAAIFALQLLAFPVPVGVWVKGLIVGGLTALIALGMALTWRSNGIVSFAQGDLGMTPVVLVHLLIVAWGWSWYLAVPVGFVIAAGLGALVEVTVVRRFRNAPRLLLTVATIGLAQILAGVAILLPRLFDEQLIAPRIEPPFSLELTIGRTVFGASELLALAAVPVAVAALALLLHRSHLGLAARAAADSGPRASLFGIPIGRVQTAVWSATAVLAFVAVLLRAGVLGLPVGAALSLGVLLRALAALLIGRLTDLPVIAATAVALGTLELAVSFNASSPVVLDPILAGVIGGALLLRGVLSRRQARVAQDESTSWRTADVVRPVPAAIARLTPVRLARAAGLLAVLSVGLALPYLLPVDRSLMMSALLLYALLGCSIVVLTGWAGQVSLGQVGLFAIGAAVGAKATSDWGLDLLLALVVAGVAAAIAAIVIGFPALRLRGLELAVVTLAAALATTSWLLNPRFFAWVPSSRVERPALLGQVDITSHVAIYHLCFVLLCVGLLALQGIRRSRVGRAMQAMRDNERGAQAYGLSALRVRLTAFGISGAVAGVAGCMFAHHQQAFGTQPYSPEQNFVVFTMVILGGVGSLLGAVLGAAWFQGIRWFLPGEWQLLASGGGVLLVLLVLPSGIGGAVFRLRDRWLAATAARHGLVVPGFTSKRAVEAGRAGEARGGSEGAPPLVDVRDSGDRPDDEDEPAPLVASGPSGAGGRSAAHPAEGPSLLQVRDLEVGYDGVQVLFGVDLDVAEGEILALLGTNGAGKSTLLKAICGVAAISRGEIVFDGETISGHQAHRIADRSVRLMLGGQGVFQSLSVEENLRAAAWLGRQDRSSFKDTVDAALTPFPALEERRGDVAGDLSGGQQQQLALAMALLAQPRLLLVDELSLGLAPIVVSGLVPLLASARAAGSTIVLVEQSADLALSIADRAVFLEKGEVRFIGPAAELHERTDLLRAVFLPSGPPELGADAAARVATAPLDDREVRLRTEALSVGFGGNQAVDDVSLEVDAGEIVGIIGPNGAGKTTLFDLLSGYLPPDEGRIWLGDRDLTALTPDQRAWSGIGRSFQDARLFPGLSVEEAIAVASERWIRARDPFSAALRLPRCFDSEANVRTRVDELVELLGLGPHRTNLVRELSTGARRIVDLACLLAHRPSVILLDEPSSGIAQRESEALAPLLRRISAETGASLVIVEHDIPLVRTVADRMVAMDRGGIIANGPPAEVLAHTAVVASYLGVDPLAVERSAPEPARLGVEP